MPNWCDNSVTLSHEDKSKIDAQLFFPKKIEREDWVTQAQALLDRKRKQHKFRLVA